MKTLYLDCPTGISGDMFCAGLADLGLDISLLENALRQAGLEVNLTITSGTRQGIQGKHLNITAPREQPLRHLPDILAIVNRLPLSGNVCAQSAAAFTRLAAVEAKVHGVDQEHIHFHEVGAVDTVVDVVAAFWGVEQLGVQQVQAGSLPWFQGRIHCEHGILPLPAPAVVELLQGKPVHPTEHEMELITPTGALLVDCLVREFTSGPRGYLLATGIGLGSRELPHQPNALRCYLVQTGRNKTGNEMQPEPEMLVEEIMVLETNIDHLTGEELGACFDTLLQQGALDVVHFPGTMKKNRPGGMLQILCPLEKLTQVQQAVFEQTMTLGLRRQRTERLILARETRSRSTPMGPLPHKQTRLQGQTYARPEFEALQELARRTGRSVTQLRYLLNEQPADYKVDDGVGKPG